MPIAHQFDYVKPASIEEAIAVLADRGDEAMVLAGGTDVLPQLRDDAIAPDVLVDIKGIDGLGEIRRAGDRLLIGPLVTFTDVIESELLRESFPLFYEMAVNVSCRGVRNRATIAGNICSAVPSCDSGPVFLVYNARVLVLGPFGERAIDIGNWFTGPKETDLNKGEIVVGIEVPAAGGISGASFVKLRRYQGEDLAQASVATLVSPDYRYRIACGAVAATPVRMRRLEGQMKGREPTNEMLAVARRAIAHETKPLTDIRATAAYREHMLEVMFERGVRAAVSRMKGEGPEYGTGLI
jgi:CO/xanthine dehydrogenase FAD-binding subunit